MAFKCGLEECRLVELLFKENIEKFNQLVAEGKPPDLRNSNLAGFDLRDAHLKGLDLSGSYLRGANLRGVDLRGCNLEGVSMLEAQVSGALFPDNVSMEEVRASIELGTRIRTFDVQKQQKVIIGLLTEIYRLLKERVGQADQGGS